MCSIYIDVYLWLRMYKCRHLYTIYVYMYYKWTHCIFYKSIICHMSIYACMYVMLYIDAVYAGILYIHKPYLNTHMFYLYTLLFLPFLFSPSLLYTYATISVTLTNCILSQNETCFLIYNGSTWHGFWKPRKCTLAIRHVFLLLLLLVLHPPSPDKLSVLLSSCSLCTVLF